MSRGENYYNAVLNDKSQRKIFVGGLAWETQRDAVERYFEQFGEILEAVVITDKNTGKSKGYGFVTFRDPDAAVRACRNASPVIDGRRANCNIAALGAQKPRPTHPRWMPSSGLAASAPPFHGSFSFHRPRSQVASMPPPFGFGGYPSAPIYHMNYYNIYGNQHLSPYYTPNAFYHYYNPYHSPHASGFGSQYRPYTYNPRPLLPLPVQATSTGASTPAFMATPAAQERDNL